MNRALGEWLVDACAITHTQLKQALTIQKQQGGRLGDILVAGGMIGYLPLYQAVAQRYALPFVNLLKQPPDATLGTADYLPAYIRLRALPYQRRGGKTIIATSEPSRELERFARERYGNDWELVITSPLDIRLSIEQQFTDALSEFSIHALWRMAPERSARRTFLRWQAGVAATITLTMLAALAFKPLAAIAYGLVFFHLLYAATMLLKSLLFFVGTTARVNDPAPFLPDHSLPVYTILVPLYQEAASVEGLIRALEKLDYPASKLDIKLILEADDAETIAAAEAAKPARMIDLIRVPPSEPRTKPKACNYALQFARGNIVTIYDAEDRPDAMQLKKAAAKFHQSPKDVICLQASLRYYNAHEKLLSRWFDIEYGVLFAYLLKGLERLRIPLPLGGTSNHFYLSRLRELGEWDPYNVTEDADLGVRLSTQGYRTLTLDSTTYEESPLSLGEWMKQRSRWIKGYMQTWLVHMRHPLALYRDLGCLGFFGFQFFIGLGALVFLTGPVVWLVSLIVLTAGNWLELALLPDWFIALTLFNLTTHLLLHWLQAAWLMAKKPPLDNAPPKQRRSKFTRKRQRQAFVRAAFLYPVYWFLHSIASYKALWQLIFRPHFWEKTSHGMTTFNTEITPRLKADARQ